MSEPTLIATGKVRDIYSTSDPQALLFVASDRVSAFDVIMKNVGPARLYLLHLLQLEQELIRIYRAYLTKESF